MIMGPIIATGNAAVFSIPTIADPCNCNDPQNIGKFTEITHFHDVLTLTGTAGQQVVLTTGGANFLDANLQQIADNTMLGTIPASGVFTYDFFHPSESSGNIVVTIGGTLLAPFAISVCNANNCIEPIPTMNEWCLFIFGLLVMNLSIFFVQRQALT